MEGKHSNSKIMIFNRKIYQNFILIQKMDMLMKEP